MPPIEHFYILIVILVFTIIICVAIWRVRDIDITKDNLKTYQDYIDELKRRGTDD